MSLLGQSVDLVPSSNGGLVARDGTLALNVIARSDGTFVAYDGRGLTYVFEQPTELIRMDMWLLRTISTAGGNTVSLEYTYTTPAVGTGTASAVQVDLAHVRYNTPPSTTCAKHDIALVYGADVGTLSLKVVGNGVLARTHTLTDVVVNASATCGGAPTVLRRYKLRYTADTDLGQPRLTRVTMAGRGSTEDSLEWLPVAAYEYGSASHGGQLVFDHSATIPVPTGVNAGNIADVQARRNSTCRTTAAIRAACGSR